MFDFLHELGEAFSGDLRPADLHRRIVEGAVKILDAKGGAVYLADKSDALLAPMFITKGCPPLVEVPADLPGLASAQTNDSYFRLHHIRRGEGQIGQAGPRRWAPATPPSDFDTSASVRTIPRGAARLRRTTPRRAGRGEWHGRRGILPAPTGSCFLAIAEQSAFALYSAIIFSEAAEKKRLDQDLQVAHEIQRILLPANSPEVSGFQISGINIPARRSAATTTTISRSIAMGVRHRRRLRQRRAGIAHHGHVPERLAQRGGRPALARRSCARSMPSSFPTSRRTCLSAWPSVIGPRTAA